LERGPRSRARGRLKLRMTKVDTPEALLSPERFALALARIANPENIDEVDPHTLSAAAKFVGGLLDADTGGLVRGRVRKSRVRSEPSDG
jgi:hypothetical protein